MCVPWGHTNTILPTPLVSIETGKVSGAPQIPDIKKPKEGAKPIFLGTPSTAVLCSVVCGFVSGFFLKAQESHKIFLLVLIFGAIGFNTKFWFVSPFDSPSE